MPPPFTGSQKDIWCELFHQITSHYATQNNMNIPIYLYGNGDLGVVCYSVEKWKCLLFCGKTEMCVILCKCLLLANFKIWLSSEARKYTDQSKVSLLQELAQAGRRPAQEASNINQIIQILIKCI
jgi:hypothetical protein